MVTTTSPLFLSLRFLINTTTQFNTSLDSEKYTATHVTLNHMTLSTSLVRRELSISLDEPDTSSLLNLDRNQHRDVTFLIQFMLVAYFVSIPHSKWLQYIGKPLVYSRHG